jgi:hypothetical protein
MCQDFPDPTGLDELATGIFEKAILGAHNSPQPHGSRFVKFLDQAPQRWPVDHPRVRSRFVPAAINPTDGAPFSPSWRLPRAYCGSFDFCGGY